MKAHKTWNPAAAAVKAPVPFAAVATAFAFSATTLERAATEADAVQSIGDSSPGVLALSALLFGFDVLLPIIFARLLFVAFLEERNVRIARSVTEAATRGDGDVVAILGALHVNGVARLLASSDPIGQLDGTDKAGTWWTEDLMESPAS